MIYKSICRTASRREIILRRCVQCSRSYTETAPPAPPLLLKFRSDLKSAMKAKDTNRLNVLRSLLAETTNASKTSTPFKTDLQLLSLLRKRAAASKTAAEEFSSANRNDLRDKEVAQAAVLDEYASDVAMVGKDEITEVAARVIGKMRTDGQVANAGSVLKALVGSGGELDGKPVDKAEVAMIVKGML